MAAGTHKKRQWRGRRELGGRDCRTYGEKGPKDKVEDKDEDNLGGGDIRLVAAVEDGEGDQEHDRGGKEDLVGPVEPSRVDVRRHVSRCDCSWLVPVSLALFVSCSCYCSRVCV